MKHIGEMIRDLRGDRTQYDVAAESGLSVSRINYIENGLVSPMVDEVVKIAAVFGKNLVITFDQTVPVNPPKLVREFFDLYREHGWEQRSRDDFEKMINKHGWRIAGDELAPMRPAVVIVGSSE